jgi:hypothetical protein
MAEIPIPTRKFICRNCQRETNHWPIYQKRVDKDNVQIDSCTYSWRISSSMKCQDCGTPTVLVDTFVGHNMGGDPYIENTEYFPPLPFRIRPNWLSKLPENCCSILNEVYIALDNSLFRLASAGTRIVIDRLIIDQIGDIGSFEKKVEELVSKGIIDGDERDILLALIDAGSASLHRSFNPSEDMIKHMMDILEKILFKVCIEPEEKKALKEKAKALREGTPKRK